ncbi:MAG: multidrug effflux MFS transporter [Chlamydiae bacterium]|nr:multidrug effflux MFS transporter [Chlamydiota bacterium]
MSHSETRLEKHFTLGKLLFLSSFASVSAAFYTPALPQIAEYLNLTVDQAQVSMSIYLLGYALGHILWGPLANAFGRKLTTIFGLIIAIIGISVSLLICFFPNSWILNSGRFLTAIGASVGLKIAFTYISDIFGEEEVATKSSYLMLSFAIAPSASVSLSGFLIKHLGWLSSLYMNAIYGFLLLLLTFTLKETLTKENSISLNKNTLLNGYLSKFKNKNLIIASLILGLGTTIVYCFATFAPFVAIDEIGLKSELYGLYNLIPSIGMIFGFFIVQAIKPKNRLLHITTGVIVFTACAFIMVLYFFYGIINVKTLFLPMVAVFAALSVVFANVSAIALGSVRNKSYGSSIMNFVNMSTCAFLILLSETLRCRASSIIAIYYACISFLMLILVPFLSLQKNKL